MKNSNRQLAAGILLSLAAVGAMLLIEMVLQPGYWIKSLFKVTLMTSAMLLYGRLSGKKITEIIGLNNRKISRKLLFWTLATYLLIIGAFLLLKDQIDLTSIREKLMEKEEMNTGNFLVVFAYIIVVNSLLEEAFFRGFVIEVFSDSKYRTAGLIYSSLLFGIYHIGIVATWFSPLIYILSLAGLTGAGIYLYLIRKANGTMLANWLVHATANLAINTIGTFMMLG